MPGLGRSWLLCKRTLAARNRACSTADGCPGAPGTALALSAGRAWYSPGYGDGRRGRRGRWPTARKAARHSAGNHSSGLQRCPDRLRSLQLPDFFSSANMPCASNIARLASGRGFKQSPQSPHYPTETESTESTLSTGYAFAQSVDIVGIADAFTTFTTFCTRYGRRDAPP